jgi:hypothetical protein
LSREMIPGSELPSEPNLEIPAAETVRYRCPGDPTDISSAVHLSRLASFYHKCQLCEHRHEVSRLAPAVQSRWAQLSSTSEPVRLFQSNGIRGRYLNRVTRHEATQIAAVFASTLREVVEFWRSERKQLPVNRWLKVAFGHDSRPSSADLAIAAAASLRQHGCEVWDLGVTVRPQLDAAIREAALDGAFLVTGHGSPVGWNGFDLIGPDGVIWSLGGMLDVVEQRFHEPCPRADREAAPDQPYDAVRLAVERVRRSLHGVRPIPIEISCRAPVVLEVLEQTRSDWPGTLSLRDSQFSCPASESPVPPELAFEIAEDGVAVQILEYGRTAISPDRVLHGLGVMLLDEHPHVDVVLSDPLFEQLQWTVQRCGPGYLVAHQGGQTEESLIRTMRSLAAPLAADGQGRFWIRQGAQIMGDALETIVLVLKSMSRSDQSPELWGRERP